MLAKYKLAPLFGVIVRGVISDNLHPLNFKIPRVLEDKSMCENIVLAKFTVTAWKLRTLVFWIDLSV